MKKWIEKIGRKGGEVQYEINGVVGGRWHPGGNLWRYQRMTRMEIKADSGGREVKSNMKQIFTREWWEAAGIRAIKTVAQTAIATIGTSAVLGDVNWLAVGSASVLAGILSLLTSLAGLPEVEN